MEFLLSLHILLLHGDFDFALNMVPSFSILILDEVVNDDISMYKKVN